MLKSVLFKTKTKALKMEGVAHRKALDKHKCGMYDGQKASEAEHSNT
jgi:hypothetical protein